MIDMHAHWRPAEIADALRARTKEPRILLGQNGAEVLKSAIGETSLDEAFDDAAAHLARMDRQGVAVSVLSLLGTFCWIEAQPPEIAGPLCERVNDGFSAICRKHPGRFAAFAALPNFCIRYEARSTPSLGISGLSWNGFQCTENCKPSSARIFSALSS